MQSMFDRFLLPYIQEPTFMDMLCRNDLFPYIPRGINFASTYAFNEMPPQMPHFRFLCFPNNFFNSISQRDVFCSSQLNITLISCSSPSSIQKYILIVYLLYKAYTNVLNERSSRSHTYTVTWSPTSGEASQPQ